MGNIVLLDELTINKIAAGEVIERPASVVKEMVENSIDAGATNINIEIKNGGISYIRVSDNGKGIEQDDLEIAFERHATSKIRRAEDLETVKSMGFRGEALASIAAIANVEMTSRTENAEFGYKIIVEAGQVIEKEETGCAKGTTIIVRNLFFNTPVRYKFLKKDYTESGYIEDAITRLALIHPEIAFKLENSGKTVIQTIGDGSRKNCIYSIFGKDIANGIIDVNYRYEDLTIDGVIGKPDIARNNRSQQIFFVNNRYIKDKTLSSAIEQGYKGLLTIGKHAFCIINVKMDPSQVDVNVHPAKLEVRFNDENKIFKAIYHTVKDNLLKSDLIRHAEQQEELQTQDTKINQTNIFSREAETQIPRYTESRFSNIFKRKEQEPEEKENLVEQLYYEKETNKNEEINKDTSSKEEMSIPKIEYINYSAKEPIEKLDFNEMYNKTFGREIIEEKKAEYKKENQENTPTVQTSVFENTEVYKQKPNYKFIGIVFSTYIIFELDNTMYILDQHAAHERIMYEKIRRNFYNNESKDSQMMLLPDIITLTHKELEIVKANNRMFEKAGFMIEEFGENTIKLVGVPNSVINLDTKELFVEILDAIDTVSVTAMQEKEEKFIATVACKAAVKANMALTEQEVDYLMDDLLKLPNPFTCPHGRPTAIQMSKTDIEKKFSRR